MAGKPVQNLVRYLSGRERGRPKRHLAVSPDDAALLAEEKATLPVQNQSCELSGQCRSTFLMTFSPDGNKVASTHGDHTVRVTEVKSGRCTHILRGHPRTPWCVAFQPSSGDILASGCLGGEVRIWDLRGGGSEVWKSDQGSVIASIAFHPTDQVLVIATANELLFWDWTRPKPFARTSSSGTYERVRWVKFDPWGHYLYTGIANAEQAQVEEPAEQVSYINGQTDDNRSHLQERYRHLVDQFTHYQRDRLHTHYPEGSGMGPEENAAPATATAPIAGETPGLSVISGPHQVDLDIVEPRSPSQLEALEEAQQYAEDVTRQSQEHAEPFPYEVSSATLGVAEHADMEREVVRIPNAASMQGISVAEESTLQHPEAAQQAWDLQELGANSLQQLLAHDASEEEGQPSSASASPAAPLSVITSSLGHNHMYSTSSVDSDTTVLNFPRLMPYGHLSVSITRHHPPAGTSLPVVDSVPSPDDGPTGLLSISSTANLTNWTSTLSTGTTGLPSMTPRAEESGHLPTVQEEDQGDLERLSSSTAARDPNTGLLSTACPTSQPSFTSTAISAAGSQGSMSPPRPLPPGPNSSHRNSSSHNEAASILSSLGCLPTSQAAPVALLPSPAPVTRPCSRPSSQATNSGPACSLSSILRTRLCNLQAGGEESTSIIPSAVSSEAVPRSSSEVSQTSVAYSTAGCLPSRMSLLRSHLLSQQGPDPQLSSSTAVSIHSNTVLSSAHSGTAHPSTSVSGSADSSCHVTGRSHQHSGRSRPSCTDASAPKRCKESHPPSQAPKVSQGSTGGASSCGPAMFRDVTSRPSLTPNISFSSISPATPRSNSTSGNSPSISSFQSLTSRRPLTTSASASPSTCTSSTTSLRAQLRETLERCLSRQQEMQSTLASMQQLQAQVPSETRSRWHLPPASSLFPDDFPRRPDIPRDPNRPGRPLRRTGTGGTVPDASDVMSAFTAPAASNGPPVTGLLTTSAPTAMSSLLSPPVEHRIEHMEQLGAGMTAMTAHLDQWMSQVTEQRHQHLQALRQRSQRARAIPPYQSRQMRRRQRLRAHLEKMKRRYNPNDHSHTLLDGSALPTSNPMSDASREIGAPEGDMDSTSGHSQAFRAYMAQQLNQPLSGRASLERHDATWHRLERRHLHPHYSVSILDDTINRQNDFLQAAINRAIAGAFMGVGESAVASNIVNVTHRIQRWDFRRCSMPPQLDQQSNVVVTPCKLHNDASCDISANGELLAAFVPSHRGFPDDTILGVFSLLPDNLGQCIYTKSFGPNAISLSLSPLNNYVLVGLAAKRLAWVFQPKQMVAQVYRLKTAGAGEDSMEPICDLMHPCDLDIRTHISVNSARWLPGVGEGMVYGTNKGDLHICRPGDDEQDNKAQGNGEGSQESQHIRRNLMQMLGLSLPSTMSTATQTVHRVRRSASTQTDHTDSAETE